MLWAMGDAGDYALPVEYQLCGVGCTWVDACWLEHLEGEVGRPARTVWLGHGARDGPARVIVGSSPRLRFDTLMAGIPGDHPTHVAFSVGLPMIAYTLPDPAVPRPDGLVRSIMNETYRQAAACQAWPEVGWTVDGVDVSARVWKFAGFWAAFTDHMAESYIMAVGTGVDADGLPFEQVLDGWPYGFDLQDSLASGTQRGEKLRVARPDSGSFHPISYGCGGTRFQTRPALLTRSGRGSAGA